VRAKNHTHKNTLPKNTHTIPKKKKKPLDPLFKRPAASHEKDPKKKKTQNPISSNSSLVSH